MENLYTTLLDKITDVHTSLAVGLGLLTLPECEQVYNRLQTLADYASKRVTDLRYPVLNGLKEAPLP